MTKTILLADDSVTIQKVVELTFMDQDYEVVAVSDGRAALAKLSEARPDLVIADVHMPEANGYEVCKEAKQKYPGLPVLLLVGTFEPFDLQQAHAVGADSHLKKPFDSQDLLQEVDTLISQSAPPEVPPAAPAFQPSAVPVDDAPLPTPPEPAAPPPTAGIPESPRLPEAGAPPIPTPGSSQGLPNVTAFRESDPPTPPPAVAEASASPDAASRYAEPESFFPPIGSSPEPEPVLPEPEPALPEPESVPPEPESALPEPESALPEPEPVTFEPEPPVSQEPVFESPEPASEPVARETRAVEPPQFVSAREEPEAELPPAAEPPQVEAAAPAEPPPPANGDGTLSDDDVDRIARRLVQLIGDEVIRQVAWDVVPDLAEVVIKERIKELESQVE